MKAKNVLWLMCCIVLLLGACSGGGAANDLEGTLWVLKELNGQNPIDDHLPTILFEDGQVSGNANCNHYGGSYRIKSETIRIEDLFNTEMACMEPVGLMEQESLYLELLRDVNRFQVSNDVLTIFTNSGQALVFENGDENPAADSAMSMDSNPASGESVSSESVRAFNLPDRFKEYRDDISGISIYIPDNWVVTGVVDGQYAIFQSYPEDKYIGGEMREEGDTKCDLNIQPQGTQVSSLIEQWETSPMTEIVSQEEIRLQSGMLAQRFVVDNMGRSMVFAVDIDQRAVLLTCFGDFSQVDAIASTLQANE